MKYIEKLSGNNIHIHIHIYNHRFGPISQIVFIILYLLLYIKKEKKIVFLYDLITLFLSIFLLCNKMEQMPFFNS